MPKIAHTPAPWTAAPISSDTISIKAGEYFIGEAYDMTRSAENRANAQLIAAAPDLLAALRALQDTGAFDRATGPRHGAAISEARRAIRKATEVKP